jgi:hypothetical protein
MRRLLFLTVISALAVFANQNFSWKTTSRETFLEELDQARRKASDWMVTSPEGENPVLLYMISDMAKLSGDSRLRNVVERFLLDPRIRTDEVWRRMVDPSSKVRVPDAAEMAALQDYQRWLLYAVARPEVTLVDSDRAAMFAPDRFIWGSRTHQLLSLVLYRSRGEDSPTVNGLVNQLCEKTAAEALWDARVTDLYLQRIAVVLAAGRPDLIRRRWVERVIASQTESGGWTPSWYGWGPGILAFDLRGRTPNSHSTVQGAWILYMLKYRFPDWIQRNYHS